MFICGLIGFIFYCAMVFVCGRLVYRTEDYSSEWLREENAFFSGLFWPVVLPKMLFNWFIKL